MSAPGLPPNRSIPAAEVIPVLVYEDVGAAVDWLCGAFGFRLRHARAARHGARILAPPADQPYGERQHAAEDPAGRRWTFSQTIADVAPEERGGVSGPAL